MGDRGEETREVHESRGKTRDDRAEARLALTVRLAVGRVA
jgi:hypothetical protein